MPTETFFNLPEDKRRLILDLAIAEFAENDYHSASISRIVARAGIAKGSFYQYFADKQDLYLYLLQLATEEKTAFLQGAEPPDPAAGFFGMLRWMFRHGLDFEFSSPQLAQIGYRAVYGDAPLPDETAALLRGSMAGFFRPLIDQGMAQGDIDPALDAELVSYMVYAVVSQLGDFMLSKLAIAPETLRDQGARALDRPGYEAVIDDLVGILERGLSPAARPIGPPAAGEEMMEQ